LVLNSEVTLKEFVNPVAEEEAWIEDTQDKEPFLPVETVRRKRDDISC